ncbi:hypothetical protein JOQ06_006263, partial [Pogonophryne albipinna]
MRTKIHKVLSVCQSHEAICIKKLSVTDLQKDTAPTKDPAVRWGLYKDSKKTALKTASSERRSCRTPWSPNDPVRPNDGLCEPLLAVTVSCCSEVFPSQNKLREGDPLLGNGITKQGRSDQRKERGGKHCCHSHMDFLEIPQKNQ